MVRSQHLFSLFLTCLFSLASSLCELSSRTRYRVVLVSISWLKSTDIKRASIYVLWLGFWWVKLLRNKTLFICTKTKICLSGGCGAPSHIWCWISNKSTLRNTLLRCATYLSTHAPSIFIIKNDCVLGLYIFI